MANLPWLRENGRTLVLTLHVQPGARRTEIVGTHGEGTQMKLKVRLAAPPVDGKANAELLRFLAAAFAVPLRNATLLRGETSRAKVVKIDAPTLRPDADWV